MISIMVALMKSLRKIYREFQISIIFYVAKLQENDIIKYNFIKKKNNINNI